MRVGYAVSHTHAAERDSRRTGHTLCWSLGFTHRLCWSQVSSSATAAPCILHAKCNHTTCARKCVCGPFTCGWLQKKDQYVLICRCFSAIRAGALAAVLQHRLHRRPCRRGQARRRPTSSRRHHPPLMPPRPAAHAGTQTRVTELWGAAFLAKKSVLLYAPLHTQGHRHIIQAQPKLARHLLGY